ncbi:hypothetical protein K3495_g5106 [Podosphaera aphanis]|nr:hypothetical protein K3495_g5106 [Podosphaera aphanis]
MPRDDLSIDFVDKNKMSLAEQQDTASVLDEWTNRVANLPNEIAFMYEEIEQKDKQIADCLAIISRHDNALQSWVRKNGGHVVNPKENALNKIILENFNRAQTLQNEKIALAQKCQLVVDKHTRYLDNQIKALQDRGEFPDDPELPSLLRHPPEPSTSRIATVPQIQPPSSTQVNQRAVPTHVQAQQIIVASPSSTPSNPISNAHIGRQARESSLGAPNKRQRLVGTLTPHISSSSARQSSLGSTTPKLTAPPASMRAGSTGPRTQIKTGPKKIAPQGSKQSGLARRHKKSGLSRVKRIGNKNSPTPTNDSELSDAESGSAGDEDEPDTPKPNLDGEQDVEMAEVEEDDGADDRKYCTCQSVSYGDMVACDNPRCEFEWFHWSCVGLKSEPLGTWICSACKSTGFKK